MLRSVRSNAFPELDVVVESHTLVHRDFRVNAFHARHVVLDDALFLRAFDRLGTMARPVVTCVLEGAALVRTPDRARWVAAGSGFSLAHKESLSLRCEGRPEYRTLVLEWKSEAPAGEAQAGFDLGQARPIAESLWHALRRPGPLAPIRRQLAELSAALRAAGVMLPTFAKLGERVPPRLAQISAVLDAELARLDVKPMTIDLQSRLGLSPRQLSRLVRELHARYGFNADGWIDVRNRRRTMLAVALLSNPRSTVTGVARMVGYSAPQVMARAFAAADLPAPREVAQVLRELRQEGPGVQER